MSNIEQGMSNNRSFLKEINQYPLLRYSAVPCSAVLRFKIKDQGIKGLKVTTSFNSEFLNSLIFLLYYRFCAGQEPLDIVFMTGKDKYCGYKGACC